jgi:D-alanyl-D-alanine carboxypeptidase (penicillin-binding protein 5/6)
VGDPLTGRVPDGVVKLGNRIRRELGRRLAPVRERLGGRPAPGGGPLTGGEPLLDGRPFFGSRLGVRLGLVLAGLALLGSAAWSLSTDRPAPHFGGTVTASDPNAPVVPMRLVQTISQRFVYPGRLGLDWPSSGTAAIEVAGMGLLGSSGSMTSRHSIASITKTMTAYVILRDHPLTATSSGPTIRLTYAMAATYGEALANDESAVAVKVGERITERQALQALLLASAGDMADILALWDRGSIGGFLAEMNQQARALGMTRSSFTDPTGLASSTVSTMGDLLELAQAVQNVPALTSIVAENSALVPVAGTIYNVNRDLGVDGIDGIKTGTTAAAGSCLLFSAHLQVGGHSLTILGVVLGLPGSSGIPYAALNAARGLVASARAQIGEATVAGMGRQVAALEQGRGKVAGLGVADSLAVVGWPGLSYRAAVIGTVSAATLRVTQMGGTSASVSIPLLRLASRAPVTRKPTRAG